MSYQDIIKYYDQIFPHAELKESFLKHRLPAGGKVLDLGCGTGAYTAALCSSGHKCTGLDPDVNMLQEANSLHPECKFVELMMQDFDQVTTKIDAAFCIGNTLAYLSPDILEEFLTKLVKALPIGGKWIFQVINWDYVLSCEKYDFPDVVLSNSIEPRTLKFSRWYDKITTDSLEFHRQIMGGNLSLSHAIDTLFPISKESLQKIHQKHGFKLLECYASFNESEFISKNDSGLIMVFEKK